MKHARYLIHSLLCITISQLTACPNPVSIEKTMAQAIYQNSSLLTYDEILNLIEEIENGELEKRCSFEELERINEFLVLLAQKGVLPGEDPDLLEADVEELHECGNYFGFSDKDEIILCRSWVKKQWDHTRKFVKKHKKELIIGAAVVVAATVVVYAVAAATAAAAAAAAASSGHEHKDKHKAEPQVEPHSDTITVLVATEDSSNVKGSLEEHLTSFKEALAEDEFLQPLQKEKQEIPLSEKARNLGAYIAHDALDGVAEVVSIIPRLEQELIEIGEKVLPNTLNIIRGDSIISPVENFQNLVQSGHDNIDHFFGVEPGSVYRSVPNRFLKGVPPLPGNITGAIGRTAKREIAKLEALAPIEKKVAGTFQHNISKQVSLDSKNKCAWADDFLKPYRGKYLTEAQIRELIHQTGIRTFPRPAGIPDNYRIKLSDKSAGMKYVHPTDEHTYVRVMPGKPHSSNPSQQKPYVHHQIKGSSRDKYGNKVDSDSLEAHIPIDEFIYRDK